MEDYNKKKWEDLNLSRDEIKSIGEALKKEEFRNLLIDYVKEINDPENRKQYEQEITQLENERGVDIKFIHPSSGYVLKTSVNGESKAFINICSNDHVGKPSSIPGVDGGHRGLRWSIPHCLAPPREDLDKKNNRCMVYDVVFHPDTLHLAKSNEAFKNLVNSTALEAIEDSFSLSLDKVNLKFPKMTFKGSKHATVIRKKIKDFTPGEFSDIPNYPYPPPKETATPYSAPIQKKNINDLGRSKPSYTAPKYKVKHRNVLDMQNYTNDPLTKMSITVPDELVVEVDLPLLKNCSDASIDVTEKTLYLQSESPAKYKLLLHLPYLVDSNKGSAKFDNVKRVLIVTLPVIKNQVKFSSLADVTREDSGVESDNYNGKSNSTSSSDDDAVNEHTTNTGNELTEDVAESVSQVCNQITKRFLKPNIYYVLPNFVCHLLKDTLTFALQVPNVNPESVEYCFLSKSAGFHLSFVSIGSSFFPVHYAMYMHLPCQAQIENESFHVEVWDNNVIAQVKFTAFNVQKLEYYVGTDKSNVKSYKFPEPEGYKLLEQDKSGVVTCVSNSEEHVHSEENTVRNEEITEKTPGESSSKSQDERKCSDDYESLHVIENGGEIDCKYDGVSRNLLKDIRDLSVSESATSSFDESTSSPTHRQTAKSRTFSESHNGETMRNKRRGILKIGRSLSESSVDDYASWSGETTEKPKKTVRFSEVIVKQTFRMNSSILGQRKKNQRKTRNKKRALERRLSESGNESEGENEVAVVNGKGSTKKKEFDDVWLKEAESSSCDVSEVSEVSDVSESDDGQKEDVKQFMPCSSKQNHKRRGKKSARKNAATAKLQFMEN